MLTLLISAALLAPAAPPPGADDAFFEAKVRPVLVERCVRCHGPEKASGELRLDSREALLKGGESGPAIVPGKPAESLLVRAVKREKSVTAMPADKPLPPDAVAALEAWVAAGAPWPVRTTPVKAARHWAFEPMRDARPSTIPGRVGQQPVDAFVEAKQREAGVKPVAAADKIALVRRATFDLTGLPPTPEEVEVFLKDTSPQAFGSLIDRLLASPRYGEKWGRMWLDVVRYADTAGETADYPVPDAWRYRDYVIQSFNADKPYDQFLREQLAGDILAGRLPADAPPGRYAELVTATGYLAVARRFGFDPSKDHFLTLEDTIDTLGKSVLGLTIGCARCHDHKYDPVSAADYYALYGIFESTRYPAPGSEKDKAPKDMVPLVPPAAFEAKLRTLRAAADAAEKDAKTAEDRFKQATAKLPAVLTSGDIPNGGKQTFAEGKTASALKTVRVRKGEMLALTVLPKANHGADTTLVELEISEQGDSNRVWNLTRDVLPDFHQNGSGFCHDDALGNKAVWHFLDSAGTPRPLTTFVRDAARVPGLHAWRGSEDTPSVLANTNAQPVAFITIKQPAKSVAVHPGQRGGVVVAWESPIDGTVAVTGCVEDIDPTGGDGIAWTLTHGPGIGRELTELAEVGERVARARRERDEFARTVPYAYAVAEGQPHDAQLHKRGDPEVRGNAVPRRFLTVLGGQPVPPNAGSGRLTLTDWLADPKNPLTARVMVNRVWQGHFGAGLVRTPNDFGTRGDPPTHPELLDWLASQFMHNGWSLKTLHKLIMLSDAYQRSSAFDEHNAKLDPGNRLLWRVDRRRLSAEEIRDAILAVSGDLDLTPAGPHPFPDAKSWGYTQHNPFAAVYDHNKRSVYLMTQRIKRHPFLALFDGPDPNTSTAARQTTTVPTQALFFLNDSFVHARAASLAKTLTTLPDGNTRLDRACKLLYGRPPTDREKAAAARYVETAVADAKSGSPEEKRRAAWAGWTRVMLCTNEFLYVD
ncbi:PSD1 and planctomycete cytochrome C domain-containing protein [Fimbriiglobus ruber]|uniref:Cytochrome c domain-containing protein n=1 Tax=Fimbriiglobus ruber TaxID=1908690 RepID=A0A225DP26_9BACT|nr:PSD1 and planctomycete cytochrome C domain-containing protein [Fimbriiglobus ruber]OWK43152.1 hypothetical protein FRUB_02751 [Fimbriiglobus ruber]